MTMTTSLKTFAGALALLLFFNVWAGSTSQYNMSLQDKVITGPKGSLTSPQAASANKRAQIEGKGVRRIAEGTALLLGDFKIIAGIHDHPALWPLNGNDVPNPPTADAVDVLSTISSLSQAEDFAYPQGVYSGAPVEHGRLDNGAIVNETVLAKNALTQAKTPEIIKVMEGFWVLAGYHWGYASIIEGDTGLIIYDTGDDIEEGREILELAKKVSEKPIAAIIYSHAHYVFGAKPLVEAGKDVKVIGHPDLNHNILESGGLGSAIPELAPVLLARTLEQFSVLLPEKGPDGRAPTPVGQEKGFVPVNTPVTNGQKMTVDGVEMIFYTDYDTDTTDQVMVYLPKHRAVLNNHLWPTFPNFYTLRGSEYRDPTVWASGISLIRDLQPEHLLNTHTLPISGREKVHAVLNSYYDAIMYLYDQTIRGILHGKTPDELRYWVQLPKELADKPHNQMTYGEFSYYPPYIHQYAIGWFGRDVENLNRIAPDEQAKKIVEGFGGVATVKQKLQQAIDGREYAWASELGGYLVRVVPQDAEARQLLADALRQMGYNTEAGIPRSWYLTKALALEGKLKIPTIMYTGPESVLGSSPDTFVKQYPVRLDPKVSVGKEQQLSITLLNTDASVMALHVRGGVAEYVPDVKKHYRNSDLSISMPIEAWAAYYVGDTSLDDLLARKDVKVSSKEEVKAFFSMFDQVHPSKMALIPPSAGQ